MASNQARSTESNQPSMVRNEEQRNAVSETVETAGAPEIEKRDTAFPSSNRETTATTAFAALPKDPGSRAKTEAAREDEKGNMAKAQQEEKTKVEKANDDGKGETKARQKRHQDGSVGREVIGVSPAAEAAAAAVKTFKLCEQIPPASSPASRNQSQPRPSPVFVSTSRWPQRSPMGTSKGAEHRLQIDPSSDSTPSPNAQHSYERKRSHDEIAHTLFTESFESISYCNSGFIDVQRPATDGLLPPEQKRHSPTGEELTAGVFSPRSRASQNSNSSDAVASPNRHRESQDLYNSSLERREDPVDDSRRQESRHQGYTENSLHSPPRQVCVDGDDNGGGDISPIKFSPQGREATLARLPDRPQSRYSQGFASLQYCQFVDTTKDSSDEPQQKATEISFDTSAGNNTYLNETSSHRESNQKKEHRHVVTSKKRRAEHIDTRPRSYSGSTITEPNNPPNREVSVNVKREALESHVSHNNSHERFHKGYQSPYDRVHGYRDFRQPFYSNAPLMPQDFSLPHHSGNHHPNHKYAIEGNLPPRATSVAHNNPDQIDSRSFSRSTMVHRNNSSGRTETPPSQILRSRVPYQHRQDCHPNYRQSVPNKGWSPYVEGPWMDPRYPELRNYPPPRARLPPPPPPQKVHWDDTYNPDHHPMVPTVPEAALSRYPQSRRGIHPPPRHQRHHQHIQLPPAPPIYQRSMPKPYTIDHGMAKNSFELIRSVCKIFQGCSYLLQPATLGMRWGNGHENIHANPKNLKVARRRIESAICALGGYIKDMQQREQSPSTSPSSYSHLEPASTSVFRRRMEYGYISNDSILYSGSTKSSDIYKGKFHERYFIGKKAISWDVEENPPVFVCLDEGDKVYNRKAAHPKGNRLFRRGMQSRARIGVQKHRNNRRTSQMPYNSNSYPINPQVSSPERSEGEHKTKYRCKLCGQPKHNHVCPYRKSLVRTLGIQVCPAANAYISAEPGTLTSAISEMNNFVPYGRNASGESSDPETDVSSKGHSSSTPGDSKNMSAEHQHHSPSSLSNSSQSSRTETHHPRNTRMGYIKHQYIENHRHPINHPYPINLWQKKHVNYQPSFMTLALRPEHYRAVTPRTPYRNSSAKVDEKNDQEEGSYEYPHVPVTFEGRKRMTDTLFYISREIPAVMEDVGSLLRMARENDEWDLAVAEVLTQVLVITHCAEGDYQLNGLKEYLFKLGIAT